MGTPRADFHTGPEQHAPPKRPKIRQQSDAVPALDVWRDNERNLYCVVFLNLTGGVQIRKLGSRRVQTGYIRLQIKPGPWVTDLRWAATGGSVDARAGDVTRGRTLSLY
jgi:hypothetical protein